jgi:hypothetical protein
LALVQVRGYAPEIMRAEVHSRGAGNARPAPAFAGIDVACAIGKRLPVNVSVRRRGRLVPLPLRALDLPVPRGAGNAVALEPAWCTAFADATAVYLRAIERSFGVQVVRIGIDAPSDPRPIGASRRMSEAALARRGIACFATPSAAECDALTATARAHLARGGPVSRLPHANRIFMLVGFALFTRLRCEWECLEVYPQGAVAVLGCNAVHKSRRDGLTAQRRAVARAIGWRGLVDDAALRATGFGAAHDLLDAYLAAWIASLDPEQREPLGGARDDTIWLPRLPVVRARDARARSRRLPPPA